MSAQEADDPELKKFEISEEKAAFKGDPSDRKGLMVRFDERISHPSLTHVCKFNARATR